MKKYRYRGIIIRIVIIAIITACAIYIPSWVADAVIKMQLL